MENFKMDQTIVNWVLAGFGALIGFLLNSISQTVKDLQNTDKEIAAKVSEIEILVAGAYVKKDELERLSHAIFNKLDRIEDKLDGKVDKPQR